MSQREFTGLLWAVTAVVLAVLPAVAAKPEAKPEARAEAKSAPAFAFPKFADQVVDADAGVGYAISVADIDGDGKLDIVAVTEKPDRVVWYRNPDWKRFVIVETTPKLPVCVQPMDVDGDGKTELILGADWQPANTKTGGSVWLLRRPTGEVTDKWTAIKLDEEPSMHRFRTVRLDGRDELVCSSLQGRDTRGPDWLGSGAGLFVLRRPPAPGSPFTDKWIREPITDKLHVVHNVWPVDWDGSGAPQLLAASFEGLFHLKRETTGGWTLAKLADGDQVSRPNRGCSEVKVGSLGGGKRYVATTEPWHGHQAVVYVPTADGKGLSRQVLLADHKGGHAVWTADLTGSGVDSLVVGFRGPPEGKPGEWVLYVLHPTDAAGTAWAKLTLDATGMGCEDAVCVDLNGDGRLDIVAIGRGTHNVKIYWNQGR